MDGAGPDVAGDEDVAATGEALASDITPSTSGVAASTSTSSSYGSSKAVDGSLSSHWSGSGDGAWLRVDLGTAMAVKYVKLASYEGDSRRYRFDLQVSTDGSHWTTVWSGRNSGSTNGRETYDFDDVSARYVRYVGHGYTASSSSSSTSSVSEIEIYGTLASSTIVGCALPASMLDLSRWKEQLPFGSPVVEVRQPELATYSVGPYFRANSACTGVQLRAPTNGTTTSGSPYPRSELREMSADGLSLKSWSTTSGTHTMFIDQAVTHLPKGKREIGVGQIHDGSNDIIMIRVEGSQLIAKPNGKSPVTLDSSYSLGQRFTVKLVAAGGAIKLYYNGSTTAALTVSRSASSAFFKAGAYTQSNCATEADRGYDCGSDNYGETVIYDLWVQHQ